MNVHLYFAEYADITEQKTNIDERLGVLKDSKRVVELKYQNILTEKSSLQNKVLGLNQSNELMQVRLNMYINFTLSHIGEEPEPGGKTDGVRSRKSGAD